MKKVLLMIAIAITSAGAFANTQTRQSDRVLKSEIFNTEQKAQQAGFKIIHDLRESSSNELSFKLGVAEPEAIPDTIKVNDSELKVESVYVEPDVASYRALVNVSYQYQVKENQN